MIRRAALVAIASIPVFLLGGCMMAGELEREQLVRDEERLVAQEQAVLQQPCETKTMIIRRVSGRNPPSVTTQTTLQEPGCGRTGVVVIDR